jgi:hypothetical protein
MLLQAFFIYVAHTKFLELSMLPSTDKNNMKPDETKRISFIHYIYVLKQSYLAKLGGFIFVSYN